MRLPSDSDTPRHVIGVVAHRTGLRVDRIRAWERRYGAVTPSRTSSGRRLFSDAEVRRLRLLRAAVEQGRAIGTVAHLKDGKLVELVGVEGVHEVDSLDSLPAERRAAGIEAILDAALGAILRLDRSALEGQLARAAALLSRVELLEEVLAPLMERVGELWRDGTLRPVQEHMASAVLRSLVETLARGGRVSAAAPKVVVSTPRRQQHEMGALVVAAGATASGWQALYLGPGVPAEEIAAAVRGSGALAVALSITYPPDDEGVADELIALGRCLPRGVVLLVGGRSACSYGEVVERAGGRLVGRLGELGERLAELVGEEDRQPPR